MDDWRHRILQGLRGSHLLLVCLSPGYLESEYCEWEFVEYLKHEVARGFVGEGVAPVYFVAVPGWEDKDFEKGGHGKPMQPVKNSCILSDRRIAVRSLTALFVSDTKAHGC